MGGSLTHYAKNVWIILVLDESSSQTCYSLYIYKPASCIFKGVVIHGSRGHVRFDLL